jgi:hypothetical protein
VANWLKRNAVKVGKLDLRDPSNRFFEWRAAKELG